MMASRCNMQYFQNQRLSLRLLALVSTMMFYFAVTETKAMHFSGKVGGNVDINCPFDKNKPITFFYFQKDNKYVNGFYTSRNITVLPWNNTRVYREEKITVHMYNLTVSHNGVYQCLIQYDHSDSQQPVKTDIHLNVTARYSKPEVTVLCQDENHCLVKCTSHGGYPKDKVAWHVPDSQVGEEKDSSETENPYTKLFNISSTRSFNCSRREPTSIKCYVGDVMSDDFSVCKREDPPIPFNPYVSAAVICVVAIVLITAMVVWWRCKKRLAAAPAVVRQEWGVSGHEGEAIALSEEAS